MVTCKSAALAALTLVLAGACGDDRPPAGTEVGDDADESGESESGEAETGETGGEPQWPTIDLDALPYEYLSEYGLFTGDELAALEPAVGVYPYTVVSPLFSDFADKDRLLYLP